MLVAVPVMSRTVVAAVTVPVMTAVAAIVVMMPPAIGVLLVLADRIVGALTLVHACGIIRALTLVLAGRIVGTVAGLRHAGTTECKRRRDRQKSGNTCCFQFHGPLLHRGTPG